MSRFIWLAAIAAIGLSACGDRSSHEEAAHNASAAAPGHSNATHSHEPANNDASANTAVSTQLSAYISACVEQGEWPLEMCQCMDREADTQLSVPAKAYLTATTMGDSAQANRIARDNGARVGIEAISFLTEGVMACG